MASKRDTEDGSLSLRLATGLLGLTLGFGGTDLLLDQTAAKPLPAFGPAARVEVEYRNCEEVRAAGAAAIKRGDPGYGLHLDRDGNGIGCE